MDTHNLKDYLKKNNIAYDIIKHPIAYTAQEIAELSHLSSKKIAKTVIVSIEDELVMVVTSAHLKVDLSKLQKIFPAKNISLATETQFQNRFPNCELGAMPPLGTLFNMKVYITEELTKTEKIAFNAGTHAELIEIRYQDYAQLVHPVVIR